MTKRSTHSLALGFIAVCVVMFVGLTGARADIYVIESTASGVTVGTHLSMNDTVAIPQGAYIRAVLPSGKTQTIRGPFSGKVSDLTTGAPPNENLIVWLKNLLKTGGSTESTTGATRSVSQSGNKPRNFSWTELPTASDATICIQKGTNVVLTRTLSSRSDRASLVDASTNERGEVVWEAGSQTAPWPGNIKLRADGTYHLYMSDRPRRLITLRVVDRLPDDAEVLTELHRLGCKYQFEVWVRERMLTKG